jgi:hypothetical protein
VDERERRIGLNEAVFREANEQIRDLNEAFAEITNRLVLVCECGSSACTEQISMTPPEYEAVRAEASQFAIARGHEITDVEDVIAEHERYNVVRKKDGIPRRIAEVTDPR